MFAASITFLVFGVAERPSPPVASPEACVHASSFLDAEPQRAAAVTNEDTSTLTWVVSDGQDTVWLDPGNGALLAMTFDRDATLVATGVVTSCAAP